MGKSLKQRVHQYSSNCFVDDDEDFELCSKIENETWLAKYRCQLLTLAVIVYEACGCMLYNLRLPVAFILRQRKKGL